MRSWWSRTRRALRLFRQALKQLRRPGEALLCFRIVLFALAVPVLLRLKLPTLEKLLMGNGAVAAADSAMTKKIITCIDSLLATACRPPGRSRCLTRGLSLFYFLRKGGLNVTLCFGIGKINGQFAGHCWLIKDGEPFLEAQDPRTVFTAIYAMPHRLPTDHIVSLPEQVPVPFR
jgi:Transglutaminase-like superfamily